MSIINLETLTAGAKALGVPLSCTQIKSLATYGELLLRWNSTYNLTAIDSPSKVLTHHLLDSLALLPLLNQGLRGNDSQTQQKVLDVGSGGGLPGVVLAISAPDLKITLVDKVQKKVAFLTQVKVELNLVNLQPLHARVETLRESFDVVVARAFSSLPELVRLTRPLLASSGRWLAMKGRIPEQELKSLPPDVVVSRIISLQVPGLKEERHVIELTLSTTNREVKS